MLEVYFESPFTLNTLRNGPCGAWLDGFAAALQEHGYTWWTGRHYLRAAHHLGHFLKNQERSVAGLDPSAAAGAFRSHLERCRCPRPNGGASENTVRGVKCFIRHLQDIGIAAEDVTEIRSPLVEGFRRWLDRHRGASETTVDRYGEAAAEILREVGADPVEYDAERLRSFVLHRVGKRCHHRPG